MLPPLEYLLAARCIRLLRVGGTAGCGGIIFRVVVRVLGALEPVAHHLGKN
jgi:hypothetical protein